MFKIRKDVSAGISGVLALLTLAAMTALAVVLPFILQSIIDIFDDVMPTYGQTLIFVYSVLIPAFVADISLIRLLLLVRKHEAFSDGAVARVRGISWCCFAETIIIISETIIFNIYFVRTALVVSFVAAFLGVVLRVVKNLLEEVTAIKSENDFTI